MPWKFYPLQRTVKVPTLSPFPSLQLQHPLVFARCAIVSSISAPQLPVVHTGSSLACSCNVLLQVVPGEHALAFYHAVNTTDKTITGVSTYNVTPMRVGMGLGV
jgi:hypothetical protein